MIAVRLPVIASLFFSIFSMAALPPISQEERELYAHGIITGTVERIEQWDVEAENRADFVNRHYFAYVRVIKTLKGTDLNNNLIHIRYWHASKRPAGLCGPIGQNSLPSVGNLVKVFFQEKLEDEVRVKHALEPNGIVIFSGAAQPSAGCTQ